MHNFYFGWIQIGLRQMTETVRNLSQVIVWVHEAFYFAEYVLIVYVLDVTFLGDNKMSTMKRK